MTSRYQYLTDDSSTSCWPSVRTMMSPKPQLLELYVSSRLSCARMVMPTEQMMFSKKLISSVTTCLTITYQKWLRKSKTMFSRTR